MSASHPPPSRVAALPALPFLRVVRTTPPRRAAPLRALPLLRVAPVTRALVALALGLGLTLAVAIAAHAAERKSPIPAGEVAPEIKLGDQHGRAFELGEVLKQRDFVVLAFYPKAFTSG
jgi:hypothetical protein